MSSNWDRGDYKARLNSIQGKLADLEAIDTFVKDAKDSSPFGEGGAWGTGEWIEVGEYYPFKLGIRVPDDQRTQPTPGDGPFGGGMYTFEMRRADLDRYVAGVKASSASWAAAVIGTVESYMTFIVQPTASQFQDAADHVETRISEVLKANAIDDFGLLEHSLADWHGEAADQFADYVYNRMQAAIGEQRIAAEAVRYGLAGGYAIVSLAQQSLMQLVDNIDDVLDQQLQQRQKDHESKSPSLSSWLAIAGGVIAVVAAIPTGGTSLEIAAGVAATAGGLLSLGSTLTADNGEEQKIEEYEASKIGQRLIDGAETIDTNATTNWDRLDGNMTRYTGFVNKSKKAGTLWPAHPEIADGVTPKSFHHESVSY